MNMSSTLLSNFWFALHNNENAAISGTIQSIPRITVSSLKENPHMSNVLVCGTQELKEDSIKEDNIVKGFDFTYQ